MFRKEVAMRPVILWLICGMSAPVVQLLAGYDWQSVGLLGVACTALVCMVMLTEGKWGKWGSLLQAIWLIAVLSVCAAYAANSWPLGKTSIIVPLSLLALAAWSAQQGAAVAVRTAGMLFILVSIGYTLVLGCGVTQTDWNWIEDRELLPVDLALFLYLLPGAAACIPRRPAGKSILALFLIPAFAVLAAIVSTGNVKPEFPMNTYPFFEMSRSLSLFGLAERFEALVCALITVGWFSLMSFLFSCLGSQVQNIRPGRGKIGIWIGGALAAGVVFVNLSIKSWFFATGAVIFWGLLPILSQGIAFVKKGGKK